jgi:hypothetical protein
VAKISGFLLRTDIQPGIRAYAERCLTGSIM